MPGCQVLVAKSGKVIYNKSFGYHTYDRKRPVRDDDLYDLASITKVASTTLASMKLYDDGKLTLDNRLADYFEDFLTILRQYEFMIRFLINHISLSWIQ